MRKIPNFNLARERYIGSYATCEINRIYDLFESRYACGIKKYKCDDGEFRYPSCFCCEENNCMTCNFGCNEIHPELTDITRYDSLYVAANVIDKVLENHSREAV